VKQTLIATKPMTYATRRLLPGDSFAAKPADARVLVAIGKAREVQARVPVQPPGPEAEKAARNALRAEYEKKLGRRPFTGWDAAELKRRIAAGA
jgi:hypothetical protein